VTYSELVLTSLGYAAQFTGYPMPTQLPVIHRVSHEWFVEHVCHRDPEHCASNGWHREGVIYLQVGLSDDELMRRAVHEEAHYLKWLKMGRVPLTCEENAEWEGEAYRAEVMFTVQVQHQAWRRNGVLFKCGDSYRTKL
jgi:hypothetical protein